MDTVRHLSLRVGPREATSPAYAEAADWVEGKLGDLGYDVTRQRVPVPAGNSWGIDVPAGTSSNVVADPTGFQPARPHLLVGAHLDTVPQAPGAEDNASGISVVLELARMVARGTPPEVPVRFVAFGAEEPRGDGDALHHFGSRRYVELMTPAERRTLVGMVSLDRVGTRGPYVPACSGPGGDTGTRDDLARAARALGLQVELCDDNASSDHWSFTKAGLPSARLGSIPYAGYHSAEDLPRMVDPTQLNRVGRTMWRWLGTQRTSP
jgi:Zn-dependent M28 family amino/carboxypeptidase